MTPCALCGEDVDRFGTKLEAELFIEERIYTIRPSFCSWQHGAAWFNQTPPDIGHWLKIGKTKAPADGGVITWLIATVLLLGLLAVVVCLIAFLP